MRRVAWLIGLTLLWPTLSSAQEEPGKRQPLQDLFFTEVVYPQSRHEVQLTLGSLVDRSREDKSALTPFSIEYGITDKFQVEAGWDGYSQFHDLPVAHPRTARLSLGAKYSWMNIGGAPIHAATGLDVEFPRAGVFTEGEGESGTQYEPFLAVAADLGHRFTLFASGGLSLQSSQVKDVLMGHQPPDDQGTVSGGALVRTGRLTFAAEYTSRSDEAPWRVNGSPLVTPSVVVHPGHEWEIGFGLPTAIRGGTHKPGLALHLIKEF